MDSIEIKDLYFSYLPHDPILENINLNLGRGEFAVIIGGNGSGKSTLIKNILGELTPDKGSIEILGNKKPSQADYGQIGYVPQMSVVEKIAFPITVLELVVLGLYRDFGYLKYPKPAHKKQALALLEEMDLYPYRNYPVNALSGGLKQRSMISRAMIHKPKILILDEPTVGVDQESRAQFLETIHRLNKEKDLSILMVTHDLEEVLRLGQAHTIYEIKNKKLERKEVSHA